jgi:hypothetical protein
MFKTIVLALDASEGSRAAVPIATELARHNGAQIVIAHVEQDIVGKGGAPVPPTEDEIQAELRRQAEELSKEGIDTRVEIRNVVLGGPAHRIAEIADEANADLIVVERMGTPRWVGCSSAVSRSGCFTSHTAQFSRFRLAIAPEQGGTFVGRGRGSFGS